MYRENDKVWLDLRNIVTDRPSKKFDWLYVIYRVKRIVSFYSVELDVLSGIYPVFYVDFLRPVAGDLLPL